MILVKESQQDLDGFNVSKADMTPLPVPVGGIAPAPKPTSPPLASQLPVLNVPADKMMADDYLALEDKELQDLLMGSGQVSIQVGEDEPQEQEFDFVLPLVPGGDNQDPIEVEPEIKVEEPEEDLTETPKGPWEWTLPTFMSWLQDKMTNMPRHSGRDTAGLERVIAYMRQANKQISRAVQNDFDGTLDIKLVEKARDELLRGIERCEERLEALNSTKSKKKSKKSETERSEIIKEASKSARFLVVVPLFISGLGRILINAMVSNGKDIEDTFEYLSKKFDLTRREEFELMQLLSDMGYAMRRDRGLFRDEPFDATSEDNPELMANYPG